MSDRQQLELGFTAPEVPRTGRLRHHHVRAHERVDEALAGEKRAASQEEIVLAWWRTQDACLPGIRFTAADVWRAVGEGLGWPLTSCRRAVSNLCRAELLVHHPADKAQGLFGAPNGRWSLAVGNRQKNVTPDSELARSVKEPTR